MPKPVLQHPFLNESFFGPSTAQLQPFLKQMSVRELVAAGVSIVETDTNSSRNQGLAFAMRTQVEIELNHRLREFTGSLPIPTTAASQPPSYSDGSIISEFRGRAGLPEVALWRGSAPKLPRVFSSTPVMNSWLGQMKDYSRQIFSDSVTDESLLVAAMNTFRLAHNSFDAATSDVDARIGMARLMIVSSSRMNFREFEQLRPVPLRKSRDGLRQPFDSAEICYAAIAEMNGGATIGPMDLSARLTDMGEAAIELMESTDDKIRLPEVASNLIHARRLHAAVLVAAPGIDVAYNDEPLTIDDFTDMTPAQVAGALDVVAAEASIPQLLADSDFLDGIEAHGAADASEKLTEIFKLASSLTPTKARFAWSGDMN